MRSIDAGEVAVAVAVGVEERLDVEAVDDRVAPPEVAGDLAAHSGAASAGSTSRPNASMNASCSWPTWWMLISSKPSSAASREPRRRGGRGRPRRGRCRARPRAARAGRPRRSARRSRGPSRAAARRRWCATGPRRSRSASSSVGAHETCTCSTIGLPSPPPSRKADDHALERLGGAVDGDQAVGPAAHPARRLLADGGADQRRRRRRAGSTAAPGRRARARRG